MYQLLEGVIGTALAVMVLAAFAPVLDELHVAHMILMLISRLLA